MMIPPPAFVVADIPDSGKTSIQAIRDRLQTVSLLHRTKLKR